MRAGETSGSRHSKNLAAVDVNQDYAQDKARVDGRELGLRDAGVPKGAWINTAFRGYYIALETVPKGMKTCKIPRKSLPRPFGGLIS